MPEPDRHLVGCNVIDPLLEVRDGTDYSLTITARSLAFLKEIGHDATEFSHACHWSEEECQAVRAMTERIGLIPWSLHAWAGWGVADAEAEAKTAAMLRIAVRNALILGTGRIVHHPSGSSLTSDDDRERLEREADLIAAVWQPGVRFALENMHSLGSMEYAIALADALAPDRAGICVDTGHAALGDLGAGRAIRMAGDRLITTHIQDNRGERDDHLPPWDGSIDWDHVIAALADVRYDGCIMLELTDQPGDAHRRVTIKEELRRGQQAARRIAGRLAAGEERSMSVT